MINTCPVPVIKGFHGWKLLIADSKGKTWRSPYLPQGTANKFLLIPACRTRACLSLSVCMGGLSSLLSSLPSFSRLSTPMWLHWEKSSWWSPRSFSGGNFSFQQHRLSVTLSLRFPYVNVMWGEQVRWPFGEWEIQVVKTEIMRNSPLSNEHPPSFVHEWVHIDAGSFIFSLRALSPHQGIILQKACPYEPDWAESKRRRRRKQDHTTSMGSISLAAFIIMDRRTYER